MKYSNGVDQDESLTDEYSNGVDQDESLTDEVFEWKHFANECEWNGVK